MPNRRDGLLVDTRPLIARHLEGDPYRERIAAFLAEEERAHRFTHWYTVEAVVSEAYSFLRRHAGLKAGRLLLDDLRRGGTPKVLAVPWDLPAALLQSPMADRVGEGFSFTDASLVVAARHLGIKSIFTVDPRDFRPFGLTPVGL